MWTVYLGASLSRSSARALMIGVLYFLGAALTIRYTRFGGGAACMWVSSAILIAELVLRRQRDWPLPIACAVVASVVASAWFGVGPIGAPLLAPFLVGEAVFAAAVLRHCAKGRPNLDTLQGVVVFVAVVGVAAPALAGIGGAVVIAALTGTPVLANWASWYFGHALGNITLIPIGLLALSGEMFDGIVALSGRRKIEGAVLIAVTVGLTVLVFGQARFPLLFLPLLPLTVAAFRFDRLGGAMAIVILATVGAGFSLGGSGPIYLIAEGTGARVLFLQFYIAVAVLMTLLISAELHQRKALVIALRESEARFRMITDRSSDVIINVTADGRIEYVSPSIRALGGYDPADLCGKHSLDLVLASDHRAVREVHEHALRNPEATFFVAYRGLTVDGVTLWCESHTRAISDENGRVSGTVSAVRDISGHKRVEAVLSRAAQTDPLTGAVNRRGFDAVMDQRLRDTQDGGAIGVCAILDLDLFKGVNDRFGHQVGDQVLCVFTDVVRRALRDGGLVARLGGEEFAVILWDVTMPQAYDVLERLRREIADLAVASGGGEDIQFTVSGGLAPIIAGHSPQQVLREADTALYRAKRYGRNRLEIAE